jgi:hypothetical protein
LGVVATTLETTPETTPEAELEGVVRTLGRVLQDTAPGEVSGDRARSLVSLLGEIERASSSGIALLSPRVIETGSYAKEGYASAPDWLGAVSGSSAGAARARLAAAERAAGSPELAEAHDGQLSAAQLKIVAGAGALDPTAPGALLSLIEGGASHQELCASAARKCAAARSKETERARRARVHAQRHFCSHQDERGGIRGEFLCDEVAWATVAPLIEAKAKERWKRAGAAAGESLEAHRVDAFLELLGGAGATGSPRAGAPRAIVLIDAQALRRGTAHGDELCEIEGVGPVSVDAARELIGAGGLHYVIKDGLDITTVTGSTRAIAQRIEVALLARDRTCVVPGCGKRLGLERDHYTIDYTDEGPTELANLARLCAPHHDMKTNGGWRLTGGPGHWSWVAPRRPPGAGAIARARRVAAAKARSRRDKPRRN